MSPQLIAKIGLGIIIAILITMFALVILENNRIEQGSFRFKCDVLQDQEIVDIKEPITLLIDNVPTVVYTDRKMTVSRCVTGHYERIVEK